MSSDDDNANRGSELSTATESREIDHEHALSEVPDEILVSVLAARIQKNPDEETPKLVRAVQHSSTRFSGPLPPPEILSGYNDVQPGFANRVIKMAEREQAHRHEIERDALSATSRDTLLGQVFAFFLSALIISGGIFLIASGHPVSGTLLTGATLTGLAYLFITGRREETEEDESGETAADTRDLPSN